MRLILFGKRVKVFRKALKLWKIWVRRKRRRKTLIKLYKFATIVIPAYKEIDILTTLQSLDKCTPTRLNFEVLVVVNEPINETLNNIKINKNTYDIVKNFKSKIFRCKVMYVRNIHPNDFGVGYARKIGLDKVALKYKRRKINGILVCLDADCTVEKNYLFEIEKSFNYYRDFTSFSIYFEHKFEDKNDPIICYELFLRYYYQGLKYANSIFATHTVGSCMAFKSDTYLKVGGMNKKKAGEDFYFLQKLLFFERHGFINTTKVYPSSRVSDRVPFGTGKTMMNFKSNNLQIDNYKIYNHKCFVKLKELIENVKLLIEHNELSYSVLKSRLSEENKKYILHKKFLRIIFEINKSSRNSYQKWKRFNQIFNALETLKYIHYMRDNFFENDLIENEAVKLMELYGININITEKDKLLNYFRELELNTKN